jgi:hypothetical protein
MANANSTPVSKNQGAAACIKALQKAYKIERRGFDNPDTNDNTVERYFRDRDEIKAVFAQGLGNLSPYQSAFLATLAEYIHISLASGEPDVFDWKPETLMTESEVKEERYQALLIAEEVEEVAS